MVSIASPHLVTHFPGLLILMVAFPYLDRLNPAFVSERSRFLDIIYVGSGAARRCWY